ncbi:MAG: peptidoglycan DD-metalloendopeptidase family protein [Eubacteriales bacterium]
MNVNQRKRQLNKGLTIALALLLVATLCITIIAFSVGRKNKPSEHTTSSTKNTEQTTTKQEETTGTTGGEDNPVVTPTVDFLCPLTAGTVAYGYSADVPVFSPTMEDYRIHCGIDIQADAGSPVYAAAAGTVEDIVFDPMMGQSVIIVHAGGYKSVYRNLSTVIPEGLEKGKMIDAGDMIGSVGDTALVEISVSPHLHFEIYKDDISVNPLSLIPVNSLSTEDYED